jgi:adenylate cyclase
VLALWLPVENAWRSLLFYYPFLVGFALIGLAPLALRRAGLDAPSQRYLFPLLDVGLFTAVVLIPNPVQRGFPPPLILRFGNEIYLFVFLTAYLRTLSPRIVLWTGVCAAAAWAAGTLWILSLPGSLPAPGRAAVASMTVAERVAAFLDPHLVQLGVLGRQVVVILVVAVSLAAVVRRMRQMVLEQSETERARANLARYFSPNLVDELVRADEVASLFHERRTLVPIYSGEEPRHGRAAIREWYATYNRDFRARVKHLRHCVASPAIEVSGARLLLALT